MVSAAMPTEPSSSRPLHPFWDRSIRSLLQRPEHLRAILSLCHPEVAGRLDFGRLKLLDRSFVLDDYAQREADLVAQLPYRSPAGPQEVIVYVLLEHQSTVDPWMPFRMLFYMTRVWDDQRRRNHAEGRPARLSPIIPVVFYTGSREWAASRDFRRLVAGPPELDLFAPQFDIIYVGLPEVAPAALEAIGPLGHALRAVQRIDAGHPEFKAILERAVRVVRPLLGDEWRELVNFLYLLITHKRPEEEQKDLQEIVFEAAGERSRQMELIEMGRTYAEALIEKGLEQGREEGLEKGRSVCRTMILRQGRHRFGEPTAAQRARLEAITDLSQLEALSETVLEAASWDDLLPD
jgi:predicted transposase YdaD